MWQRCKWQGCNLVAFQFQHRHNLKPLPLITWRKKRRGETHMYSSKLQESAYMWLLVRQIAKHDWLSVIVGVMCDLWPDDCVAHRGPAHLNINYQPLVSLWNDIKLFLILWQVNSTSSALHNKCSFEHDTVTEFTSLNLQFYHRARSIDSTTG